MKSIVAHDVPESDLRELREEARSRRISQNDLLLALIKERVEDYRQMKAFGETASKEVRV